MSSGHSCASDDVDALLEYPTIWQSIATIWDAAPKNLQNWMSRVDFHQIISSIGRVLLSDFDDGELFQLANGEWDCVVGPTIDRIHVRTFFRSMLQIALLWVDSEEPTEIANFILDLGASISVLIVTKSDNEVVRVAPSICQVKRPSSDLIEFVMFDYHPEPGDEMQCKLAPFHDVAPVERLRVFTTVATDHSVSSDGARHASTGEKAVGFTAATQVVQAAREQASSPQHANPGKSSSKIIQSAKLAGAWGSTDVSKTPHSSVRVVEASNKSKTTADNSIEDVQSSPRSASSDVGSQSNNTANRVSSEVASASAHDKSSVSGFVNPPPVDFVKALLSDRDLSMDIAKARKRWQQLRVSQNFVKTWKMLSKAHFESSTRPWSARLQFSTLSGLLAKRKLFRLEHRTAESHNEHLAHERASTSSQGKKSEYDFEFQSSTLVPAVKASSSRTRLFAPNSRHFLPKALLASLETPRESLPSTVLAAASGATSSSSKSPSRPGTASSTKSASSTPRSLHINVRLPSLPVQRSSTTGLPWAKESRNFETVASLTDEVAAGARASACWRTPDDVSLRSRFVAVRVRGQRGSGVSTLAKQLATSLKVKLVSSKLLLERMMRAKRKDPFGLLAVADHHYHADRYFVSWAERRHRLKRMQHQRTQSQSDDPTVRHAATFAPHSDPLLEHSLVAGVSCGELDAAVAHMLRGHSIPMSKCRELVYSNMIHELQGTRTGYVVDDDMSQPRVTKSRRRPSSAFPKSTNSSKSPQSIHSHEVGAVLPVGLQPRHVANDIDFDHFSCLDSLLLHDVKVDFADEEELYHRRQGIRVGVPKGTPLQANYGLRPMDFLQTSGLYVSNKRNSAPDDHAALRIPLWRPEEINDGVLDPLKSPSQENLESRSRANSMFCLRDEGSTTINVAHDFPSTSTLDAPVVFEAGRYLFSSKASDEHDAKEAMNGLPPVDVVQVDGLQPASTLVDEVLHLIVGAVDALVVGKQEYAGRTVKSSKVHTTAVHTHANKAATKLRPVTKPDSGVESAPLLPYVVDCDRSRVTFPLKMPKSLLQAKGHGATDKKLFHLRFGALPGYPLQARKWSRFGRFCPVSIHLQGVVAEGRQEFAVVHRGCVYLLASHAFRLKFLAHPGVYTHNVWPHKTQKLRLLLVNKSSPSMFTHQQINYLRDAINNRNADRLNSGSLSFTDEQDTQSTIELFKTVRNMYYEGPTLTSHFTKARMNKGFHNRNSNVSLGDIASQMSKMYDLEILDPTMLIIQACHGDRTVDAATLLLRLAMAGQAPSWRQQALVSPEVLERFVLRPILTKCRSLSNNGRGYILLMDKNTFFPSCGHQLACFMQAASDWDLEPRGVGFFDVVAEESDRSAYNAAQALAAPDTRKRSPRPSSGSGSRPASASPSRSLSPNGAKARSKSATSRSVSPVADGATENPESSSASVLIVPKDEYVWDQGGVANQIMDVKSVLRKEFPNAKVYHGTLTERSFSLGDGLQEESKSSQSTKQAVQQVLGRLCRTIDPFFMSVEIIRPSTHSLPPISNDTAGDPFGSTVAPTRAQASSPNSLGFGMFGTYCPVSWIERGVLVPACRKSAKVNRYLRGFPATQFVEVDNEVFVLRGDEERAKFEADPWKYLGGLFPRGTGPSRDISGIRILDDLGDLVAVPDIKPIIAFVSNVGRHVDDLLLMMVEAAKARLQGNSTTTMAPQHRRLLDMLVHYEGEKYIGTTSLRRHREQFYALRSSERGGFVNWSSLPVIDMVTLLRECCYPTVVVPILFDEIVSEHADVKKKEAAVAAAAAAAATAAAGMAASQLANTPRTAHTIPSKTSPAKAGAVLAAAEGEAALGDRMAANTGNNPISSTPGNRKKRNHWSKLATKIQARMGVLRSVGIHVHSPWIMQRGPPTAKAARRVMAALLSSAGEQSGSLNIAGKPLLSNIRKLKVQEARTLLECGYRKLSRFGLHCPVVAQAVSNPTSSNKKDVNLVCNVHFPVEFRGYLFFPSTEERRQFFISHADSFICAEPKIGSKVARNVVMTCALVSATDGVYPTLDTSAGRWLRKQVEPLMSKCRVLTRAHALRLTEKTLRSDHAADGGESSRPGVQPIRVALHEVILWILAGRDTKVGADIMMDVQTADVEDTATPFTPLVVTRVKRMMRGFEHLLRNAVMGMGAGSLEDFYSFMKWRFPTSLLASAVALRLKAMDCRLRGWVLTDYPRSAVDAAALAELGVVPATVIALVPSQWPRADLVYREQSIHALASNKIVRHSQLVHPVMDEDANLPQNSSEVHDYPEQMLGFANESSGLQPYTCAKAQLETVCTFYAAQYGDVVCRLSVFRSDLQVKEEYLRSLRQHALTFSRAHPFAVSMSPYTQLLRQRLRSKTSMRRNAAQAMMWVNLRG